MSLPPLNPSQRADALDKALVARRTRAMIKAHLRQSKTTVEDVLEQAENSEVLRQMKVKDLLDALPNYGTIRVEALMHRLGIAPNRRIRGLGARQRTALRIEFPRI